MPYLVEIFLPVTHMPASRTALDLVRDELTERFGGVTLHVHSPAEGLWQNDGGLERDQIVVAEVMTGDINRCWWSCYRKDLEIRFRQEEIVVRASKIERL
jgi:hypothetical protein